MPRVREFDTDATIATAMHVFRMKGYDGTSMQDLVEVTGVGRGSLYAAFGDKEGLYLAALDRYREDYATPLVELLRSGAPALEVLREVLISAIDAVVGDGSREACLIVSSATQSIGSDPAVASRLRATGRELEDALRDLVAEGQRSGAVADRRGPRDIARFLAATIHGIRVTAAIGTDRAALTALAEVAIDALR